MAQLLMVKLAEPAIMMAAHLRLEPSTRKDRGVGEGDGTGMKVFLQFMELLFSFFPGGSAHSVFCMYFQYREK